MRKWFTPPEVSDWASQLPDNDKGNPATHYRVRVTPAAVWASRNVPRSNLQMTAHTAALALQGTELGGKVFVRIGTDRKAYDPSVNVKGMSIMAEAKAPPTVAAIVTRETLPEVKGPVDPSHLVEAGKLHVTGIHIQELGNALRHAHQELVSMAKVVTQGHAGMTSTVSEMAKAVGAAAAREAELLRELGELHAELALERASDEDKSKIGEALKSLGPTVQPLVEALTMKVLTSAAS